MTPHAEYLQAGLNNIEQELRDYHRLKVEVGQLQLSNAALVDQVDQLREAMRQIRARANSLQNAGNLPECLRQLACIDHIVKGFGITLGPDGQHVTGEKDA